MSFSSMVLFFEIFSFCDFLLSLSATSISALFSSSSSLLFLFFHLSNDDFLDCDAPSFFLFSSLYIADSFLVEPALLLFAIFSTKFCCSTREMNENSRIRSRKEVSCKASERESMTQDMSVTNFTQFELSSPRNV